MCVHTENTQNKLKERCIHEFCSAILKYEKNIEILNLTFEYTPSSIRFKVAANAESEWCYYESLCGRVVFWSFGKWPKPNGSWESGERNRKIAKKNIVVENGRQTD
jgi:hypothetical protein